MDIHGQERHLAEAEIATLQAGTPVSGRRPFLGPGILAGTERTDPVS